MKNNVGLKVRFVVNLLEKKEFLVFKIFLRIELWIRDCIFEVVDIY